MSPPSLTRRTILRGIGASITLPFLESLAPRSARAAAAGATPPTRMAYLFMPNGVHPQRWTPEGAGMDWKASPLLQPLESHRQDLTILTNLQNALADGGDGHYAKSASWLTGFRVRKTTGRDVDVGGPSVDQAYAAHCGHQTRLPSLELGTEPVRKGVDLQVNFTQLYGGHISWRDRHVPLPSEINPRTAFDRLFRERGENDRLTAEDTRSVLDLTLEQAHALRGKVSAEDQRRLDEYLETIRSLETRIQADIARVASGENLDPAVKPEVEKLRDRITAFENSKDPGGRMRLDHTEHARLMLDLIAMSFWSDNTRAATFMFGIDVSSKNFSFLPGVSESHHESSHHSDKPEKLEQYARINLWHMEQYAYLLDRLKSMKEGEGSVLDNSMIMFGSSLRNGNAHQWQNLPIVLAGRGGNLRPSGHVVNSAGTPLCNLYLSLLQRSGLQLDRFGDSTAPLALA
ncbi:MAG: hypothetical protein JWL81_2604 [Verrucomicrobiales bacterium]|nr:hypothetical protein [Verrucomicrobiales bacterium]